MKVFIPNFWSKHQWGLARGYYHIFERLSSGLRKLGADVTHDEHADVDVDLFICTADRYRRRREASVLYSMWEHPEMVEKDLAGLALASEVIVPSSFCRAIFKRNCDAHISTVPLGVGEEFSYKKRSPQGKFRWLFLGSGDPRKGTDVIWGVWQNLLENKTMELYVKVTGGDDIEERIFQIDKNVFIDTRRVDQNDLVDIYHSADAFLFPTSGEGFGLTLAEAMSTGLPCICTKHSGHMDFTDKDSVYYIGLDKSGTRWAANAVHLAREMKHLVTNYSGALAKGERASKAVTRLTWDKSCRGVYTILKHAKGGMNNG